MATLTVQKTSASGLDPSYSAADVAGDQFAHGRQTILHVKNGDTASHTVTVTSQVGTPPAGTAKSDLAISVPAGGEMMIGPLSDSGFRDIDGNVQVTYDAVTSVTVAAIAVQ